MKKFELTADRIEEKGVTLHRIKALIDFGDVKAGELGGYVEKEENLSQYGNAGVYRHAKVFGNAYIYGNTRIFGNALVFEDALVYEDALVSGDTRICSDAKVSGNARIGGSAYISGNAHIFGDSLVYGNAWLCDNAQVSSDADYIYLKGFGSHNRSTTIFRAKSGNICVSCGCFIGSLQEFENKVKETHGNNKFAKEYLALVEAAKIHFEV